MSGLYLGETEHERFDTICYRFFWDSQEICCEPFEWREYLSISNELNVSSLPLASTKSRSTAAWQNHLGARLYSLVRCTISSILSIQ